MPTLSKIAPDPGFRTSFSAEISKNKIKSGLLAAVVLVFLIALVWVIAQLWDPATAGFTIFIGLAFVGIYMFSSVASALDQVTNVTYEEQSIGQIYKKNDTGNLYSFGWPVLSTINYYAGTSTNYLDTNTANGRLLKAPVYLIVQASTDPQGLKVLYRGNSLALLYSDKDVQLPSTR